MLKYLLVPVVLENLISNDGYSSAKIGVKQLNCGEEMSMTKNFRLMKSLGLFIGAAMILTSCVTTTTAVKPGDASHVKGAGKLVTKEGFKFSYEDRFSRSYNRHLRTRF
jgi:hypothetical protein